MADVLRLKRGEPLDYVIGWLPFLNCRIDLTYRPLIPRPETEFWTEQAISCIKTRARLKKKRILIADVFAGSGCIGLAVLKNVKNVRVDFAEIDKFLIKQIKINLRLNKISPRFYRVIRSDVFKNLKGRYDFILANPPYLAFKRKNKIQKSVLRYENHQALFGGPDGLFYIKKFLQEAKKHLKNAGQIWIEFDSWQKQDIEKLLKKIGYGQFKFFRDQYNRWRYLRVEN